AERNPRPLRAIAKGRVVNRNSWSAHDAHLGKGAEVNGGSADCQPLTRKVFTHRRSFLQNKTSASEFKPEHRRTCTGTPRRSLNPPPAGSCTLASPFRGCQSAPCTVASDAIPTQVREF